MDKGLYISIADLHTASGIDEQIIKTDIENSLLRCKDGKVWYRDAIKYSEAKWNQGKVNMYPHDEFAERLLDCLDDQLAEEWINNRKRP